ncbi:aminoacyl-tRNA hydrolase [Rasiella rasia]|uniref:Peptidyl-tRNA hydrolase n=1 Tax=Rasiella rasia TaxID=2744027 RepID=A0A6G6GML2_9FLAO|nr:aminoacyl-tRNA hydrolase [Rasiella rasia]
MFAFLRKLFTSTKTNGNAPLLEAQNPMKKFLIAGLGNIGPKYHNTRHNIGFKMLDFLAEEHQLTWETAKLGDVTIHKKKGRTFLLLKPSTYMNLSGKAVKYWLDKEKIPIENLLVVTDDLNLPFGTLRLKTKGSDGGHNGLKDIQNTLQTTKYPRFRFGISDAFSKGRQVDYVLGDWSQEEDEKMPERLTKGIQLIESFGLAGVNITMNTYNGT